MRAGVLDVQHTEVPDGGTPTLSLGRSAAAHVECVARARITAQHLPLCPWGGEGRGEVGDSERPPSPTSPSHACGVGPFLSPLEGGEEFTF